MAHMFRLYRRVHRRFPFFNPRCCWRCVSTADFNSPRGDEENCSIWLKLRDSPRASLFRSPAYAAVALLLICNMLVAYWTVGREALSAIFSDPGKVLYGGSLYLSVCVSDGSDLRGRVVCSRYSSREATESC